MIVPHSAVVVPADWKIVAASVAPLTMYAPTMGLITSEASEGVVGAMMLVEAVPNTPSEGVAWTPPMLPATVLAVRPTPRAVEDCTFWMIEAPPAKMFTRQL